MHFDRREKAQEARKRLLGVGHVIIDRALSQMSDIDAPVAVLPGRRLLGPLFVFRVSDRVTDRADLRPIVCSLLRAGSANQDRWEVLHDWQLLTLLNGLPMKALTGGPAPTRTGGTVAAVVAEAEAHMARCLPELGLEFHVPFAELIAVIVPESTDDA